MFMSKFTCGNIRDGYQQNKLQHSTFGDRHHIKKSKNIIETTFQQRLILFT